MAPTPTIQKPVVTPEKRRPLGSSGIERKSELVTRVKYTNTLPDLPFDPKFISYPFDHNRFVTYSTTSLERNFVYDILTEPDLGVEVELVIPNFYNLPPNAPVPPLDPKDEKLLEEEVQPQKNQKRSKHHAKSVSWLRRTEYISTEQTRFQPQCIDKVESKVGYNIKKKLKDEWHYSDRESQVKAIEKTFEDAINPIESHFAKPGVHPVEVLPVFPDFKLWKYPCAQVIFDSDPAPVARSMPSQLEEMSQAMIRGVMDESGEQFVAYFLPTEETLTKRKRDVELEKEYFEDDTYEYRMAREYNWNVKSKATKGFEENFFFVIRDDGVYYNELETRVRLNKRRTRGPNQQLNTKLCVKHIPLAATDYEFQRNREKELEAIAEEEEDEQRSDAEAGGKSDDDKSDKSDKSKSGSGSDGEKSDKSDKSKSKSDDSASEKEDKKKRSKSNSVSPDKKKTMNIDSSASDASEDSDVDKSKKVVKKASSKIQSDDGSTASASDDSDKGSASAKGSSGKSASSGSDSD